MAEFQILVPNNRKVEMVMGDGAPAALMVTITQPEADCSIQTYSVPGASPPRVITIRFETYGAGLLTNGRPVSKPSNETTERDAVCGALLAQHTACLPMQSLPAPTA
jgi:hypothetical protein